MLGQMAAVLTNEGGIQRWFSAKSESGRRFLKELDLEEIPKEIRKAAYFRNGMAHKSSADRSKVEEAIDFSFGQFTEEWKTLKKPGVFICLLDKLIACQEPAGKEK